jgi:hypothetical protein
MAPRRSKESARKSAPVRNPPLKGNHVFDTIYVLFIDGQVFQDYYFLTAYHCKSFALAHNVTLATFECVANTGV